MNKLQKKLFDALKKATCSRRTHGSLSTRYSIESTESSMHEEEATLTRS
jgi:hypothetical protein